ncbi:hypothetical protein [Kribbella ginsengisoli]|uniref:Uncharacterized protein n=1 Tax=Kribbella ginsengisoli TaxID=363865 RepID=A0ABP6XEC7_9ACTN
MTDHPGEQFPPAVDPDVEPGHDAEPDEQSHPDYDTEPAPESRTAWVNPTLQGRPHTDPLLAGFTVYGDPTPEPDPDPDPVEDTEQAFEASLEEPTQHSYVDDGPDDSYDEPTQSYEPAEHHTAPVPSPSAGLAQPAASSSGSGLPEPDAVAEEPASNGPVLPAASEQPPPRPAAPAPGPAYPRPAAPVPGQGFARPTPPGEGFPRPAVPSSGSGLPGPDAVAGEAAPRPGVPGQPFSRPAAPVPGAAYPRPGTPVPGPAGARPAAPAAVVQAAGEERGDDEVHPLVEDVVERLEGLGELAVGEHAEVYAELHERLQSALVEADAEYGDRG